MKEPKKMTYNIEPIRKILLTEAVIDGGTQKKAAELEGKWIRINETMFALVEESQTTLVYNDVPTGGCACDRFKDSENLICEHLISFGDLPNPPQLSIDSKEYRWLQEYLLSLGWYVENRYLYPSLDAELPEDEAKKELDPVNEDKDLDIGVDEEPEPTEYSRKCVHCGDIISGTDLAQVKQDIAEHTRGCPKNPANKKNPKPVTQEAAEPSTDAKSTTVEKPSKKDGKKAKPSTAVAKPEPRTPVVKKEMPTEAQFQTAAVGRLMKNQGSIYKVSGKEVADSAAVSNYAVSAGVSTETTVLEQTSEYARATVRAYKHGRYTEGSVLIRKDAILEKLMIDLAEKNPKWITGWSNGLPEFDLDQRIYINDKQKILGLHIAGTLIDKWTFAARDCETKARRRAQIQMLGADWREGDEVESEVEEMNTVAKKR